jgi:hypothetical protein
MEMLRRMKVMGISLKTEKDWRFLSFRESLRCNAVP